MEPLVYLLKSAAVLSLFYIVYTTLLKSETLFAINRYFLLLGILTAVLLPFFEFTKTILIEAPAFEPSQIAEISNQEIPPHEIHSWLSFERTIGIVYVTGVIILLSRFFYQIFTLVLLLKRYPVQKVNGCKLIKVPEAISPFSFFNYMVYNPKMHSKEELKIILNHENAHIQNYHSADVLISNILIILQWFNPLSWLYKQRIEENLEFMADHYATKKVSSKKEYQLTLIKASTATIMPSLTNYFHKSFLKKRIIMLNKTSSKKRNAFKTMTIFPLLAIFLWSFNVKEVTEYEETRSVEIDVETTSPIQPGYEIISNVGRVVSQPVAQKEEIVSAKEYENLPKKKVVVKDQFRVNINKNTTDEQLKKIKDDLRANYAINFNYAVSRNSANEIISLSINYSGNGNNGSFQVTEEDSIDEFYFFIDDDGKTGFWSETTEKRRKEHLEKRNKMMEKRKEQMKDRQKDMKANFEEKKMTMKESPLVKEERRMIMEERHKEMEARFEKRNQLLEKRNEQLRGRQNEIKESFNENTAADSDDPIYYVDGKETSKKDIMLLSANHIEKVNVIKGKKAIKKYGGKGVNGVIEISTKKQ